MKTFSELRESKKIISDLNSEEQQILTERKDLQCTIQVMSNVSPNIGLIENDKFCKSLIKLK